MLKSMPTVYLVWPERHAFYRHHKSENRKVLFHKTKESVVDLRFMR